MRPSRFIPIVVAVAAMSWAAPAFATSYGSSSSPIRIGSDGNGWFYGAITVYNQQYLRNAYYYRDTAADGNAVYVQTNWYFKDSSGEYQSAGPYDQSPRIGTADGTVHSTDYQRLWTDTDIGRGATKVCEDQSWSPDPCSATVTVTLSY